MLTKQQIVLISQQETIFIGKCKHSRFIFSCSSNMVLCTKKLEKPEWVGRGNDLCKMTPGHAQWGNTNLNEGYYSLPFSNRREKYPASGCSVHGIREEVSWSEARGTDRPRTVSHYTHVVLPLKVHTGAGSGEKSRCSPPHSAQVKPLGVNRLPWCVGDILGVPEEVCLDSVA